MTIQNEFATTHRATGRSLRGFTGAGYEKGASVLVQALWFACLNTIFMKWWCPPRLRPGILRLFGATIGERVFIRHRVRVLWPWKLTVGDDVWIGESAWLLNLEEISIDHDVCISQGVFLCTGSHDRRSVTFEYDNRPIVVRSGTWIGTQATVLCGVIIGEGAVVGARTLVTRDVSAGMLVRHQDAT
jgi:putative colanic acid biosynthesis acetyltransferase WcaF